MYCVDNVCMDPLPLHPHTGVSNPAVPSARRRTRGVVAAPGAQQRSRTDEDEALARRLQEQWISEDRVAGGGTGSHVSILILLDDT